MLVEFSVSNFRSFREAQTLSLVANKTDDLKDTNTFDSESQSNFRLLRSAVIYGPNASGKSNFIKAMSYMRRFVTTGRVPRRSYRHSESQSFSFSKDGPATPTQFEVIFIKDGIRYQYGFALLRKKVVDEWLYAFPLNKLQKWFERKYDLESDETNWYFGPKLQGHKSTWKDSTAENKLFLRVAVGLNSLQLKPVMEWFKSVTVIEHGRIYPPSITVKRCIDNEGRKSSVLQLLRVADPSIEDIVFEKWNPEEVRFPEGYSEDIKERILNDIIENEPTKVKFLHTPTDSEDDSLKSTSIQLEEESDGTRKLFSYISLWLTSLVNGRVLVIDELESSFHVQLLTLLVNLFHNNYTNYGNGQLVFATHDTVLLQKKILRRDQIWFCEKQDDLSTTIYPLTDFHPRKEDALQDRYLQGRYGAIPYTNDFEIDVPEYDEKA